MEVNHPPVSCLHADRITALLRGQNCNYCRQIMPDVQVSFAKVMLKEGASLLVGRPRTVSLLFILEGRLRSEGPEDPARYREPAMREHASVLQAGQIALFPKKMAAQMRATCDTTLVRLLFNNRPHQCNNDLMSVFRHIRSRPEYDDSLQTLSIHPIIGSFLQGILRADDLFAFPCYHQLKQKELFLLMVAAYETEELARLFMPLVRIQDDFRAFVISNYCSVATVGEFAELAGMSLSAFKRRFEEHFHESVYHWMMKHKAEKIRLLLEVGDTPIKEIMEGFGFKFYSHFCRFCKKWIGNAPSRLSAKNQQ